MLTYLKENNQSYSISPIEDTWCTADELEGHHRITPLSPVARLLLTSDGSMTQMLEALNLSAVSMIIKRQEILSAQSLKMTVPEVSERALAREALLATENRSLIFAHSLLFSNNEDSCSLESIMETEKPLGRMFIGDKIKTLRDGLKIGQVSSPDIAAHFDVPADATLWGRYYNLSTDRGLSGIIFELFSPHLF